MHHRHHNHRIKIVPFDQADDLTIPFYTVLYMNTNWQFERIWDTCETIGSCK